MKNDVIAREHVFSPPNFLRRLLLAWLFVSTLQYTLLDTSLKNLEGLDGLAAMSFPLLLCGVLVVFLLLSTAAWFFCTERAERWGLFLCFGWYTIVAVSASFTVPFLIACIAILVILGVYAVLGVADSSIRPTETLTECRKWWGIGLTAMFAVLFLIFVCTLTICRVRSFAAPTYDFGIFSQMFHNMRTTGVPNTTCERDGLLSHFKVHVSPIYYLLLPFYMLFPSPTTLQVLQALVLASAVIPLWLLARRHALPPLVCALLCGLLLFYPAYAGGTSYDLHENKFLTPLLLWLFYFIDCRKLWGITLTGCLVLMVKEDAPVYVAVIALWLVLSGLLQKGKERRWSLLTGFGMLVVSVAYFLAVTTYLARGGDGVMTYRYSNFMYDGSESLLTVVKAVLLSPMKTIFECADKEKLEFLLYTMLPLLFLPFWTRRYERFVLLIPYLLINLMSDYQYQHNIFFQYTYGSTACLFYLTVVNLMDLRCWAQSRMPKNTNWSTILLTGTALVVSVVCFSQSIGPQAGSYLERYTSNRTLYTQISESLDAIPEDASVAATTFYTVPLSNRSVLYDIRYCTQEHLLESEYIVLGANDKNSMKKYATDAEKSNGLENLCALLSEEGYEQLEGVNGQLLIFHRS